MQKLFVMEDDRDQPDNKLLMVFAIFTGGTIFTSNEKQFISIQFTRGKLSVCYIGSPGGFRGDSYV